MEQGPRIEKSKLVAASPEEVPSKNKVKIEKEIKDEKGVGFIPYIKNMFSSSEKQQPELKKVDVKASGESAEQ